MDLHFGCGLYKYNTVGKSGIEQMTELLTFLTTDIEDPRWESFRNFYMTLSGTMNFDFTDEYVEPVNPF